MNATVALLGLALGQPPAPDDYHLFDQRGVTIPIDYRQDRKQIRNVLLFVSKDAGQIWELAANVPPTQEAFQYAAPADGRYWFQIQIVDLKGGKDPPNVAAEPPAQKLLIDTAPPQVVFTNARRDGEFVTVEWKIDDKFPNDAATRVYFRPAGAGDDAWKDVSLPAETRTGVRFPAGTAGPVQVRVAVADRVGNTGQGVRDLPGAGGNGTISTSLSPGASPPAGAPPPPPDSLVPAPGGAGGPVAPTAPPPAAPAIPPPASTPPAGEPPPVASAPQPVATYDPRAGSGGVPLATGGPPPAPAPQQEPPRYLKTTRFELNYLVEVQGSSKIGRVDLWVTRDDGRTWRPWSQHPGNDPVVRVNLGTPENRQPEGLYGFRLVSVSGAGLSDAPPAVGDVPDFRVIVDLTKPEVKIYPPAADPAAPDALVLQWWAGDANFGDDPITLEWSEGPTAPWRPVATPGGDFPVQQAGAVSGPDARRLPNTGRFSWRVPAGLPPRVYLKVTARDAAGNVTEQVTKDPVLIDLTKPRAKITGVGGTAGRP